jgi:hypothetical protein
LTDQTTQGYEPEPFDVQALLCLHLGDVLDEPDWLVRYAMLTSRQALYTALVSAIKAERGKALAKGRASGLTLDKVSEAAQLGTYQRAQQLIAAADGRPAHRSTKEIR